MEPCGTRGLGLFILMISVGFFVRFPGFWVVFATGFSLTKTRGKFAKFSLISRHFIRGFLICRLCWGPDQLDPYLLISQFCKNFHLVPDNPETDQSSNKPVKAELHRPKPPAGRLRLLLLTVNRKQCKE